MHLFAHRKIEGGGSVAGRYFDGMWGKEGGGGGKEGGGDTDTLGLNSSAVITDSFSDSLAGSDANCSERAQDSRGGNVCMLCVCVCVCARAVGFEGER